MDDAAFRQLVDQVRERTDLAALVGATVQLSPAGSVLKGRSPWARDTNPSLVVWPHTRTWRDFSGGGSLGGTTSVSTSGSGTATFSSLSIGPGPGIRTLQFMAGGPQDVSNEVHVAYAGGTYNDIQYCGSHVEQRMDVSVPSNAVARPLPVAAYIHGGGWDSGDKANGPLLNEVRTELLARGYVVVSLNYRLGGTAQWAAQIQDVKCAIRHLRARAGDYGVDPSRVGTWGHSAGGHLVSMLGVTDATSAPQLEPSEHSSFSSRVQAAVPLGGISDMTSAQVAEDELFFENQEHTFATWPPPSAELDEASPIWWTTADDPPFLIVHGAADTVVLPAQSSRLDTSLDGVGLTSTLQLVTNGAHGFEDSGGPASPSIAQLTTQIANFLDTHVKNAP